SSEEYSTLRTNILYSSAKSDRTFVVSSASPQEGKSVTSSNLAVSMALSGLNVLLIDADLRRPKVHEVFGLDNQIDLTNLFTGRFPQNQSFPIDETQPLATKKNATEFIAENNWQQVVKPTLVSNLSVI